MGIQKTDYDAVIIGSGPNGLAILSPDGKRIAYRSQGKIVTRRLDQAQGTELPGINAVNANAFFSPDGKWLAFFIQGRLNKVSVEGGVPDGLERTGDARLRWQTDREVQVGAALVEHGLQQGVDRGHGQEGLKAES